MPQKRKKIIIDNKELSKEYLYGVLFYRDNNNHTFFYK